MTPNPKVFAAIAALIAAIAGVAIAVVPGNDNSPATITINVDGLDAGRAPDRTITAPAAVVAQIAPRLESDLNAPPPGTPPQQLADATAAEQQIKATQPALPTAGATAGFEGCTTSFVRNQSSRRGIRPQLMWDHYTVSHNVPGRGDGNAVVALFDRAASQASSNFIIDAEGNCWYVVPIEAKAWTQAGANATAISFEIIAYGNEREYLPPAGMKTLARVQREVSRRTGIPMRRGAVNNCTPTRSGIVQHKDGGICAGGHVDIAPFNIDQVIKDTIALADPVTAANRVTCRKINAWRNAGRRHGQWEHNTVTRVAALRKRGVRCTPRGAARI